MKSRGVTGRERECEIVGPGVCFRLYSAAEFAKFDSFSAPEIHRVELTAVALQLLALRPDADPCKFPFIEPPAAGGMQVGFTRRPTRPSEPLDSRSRAALLPARLSALTPPSGVFYERRNSRTQLTWSVCWASSRLGLERGETKPLRSGVCGESWQSCP